VFASFNGTISTDNTTHGNSTQVYQLWQHNQIIMEER